MSKIERVDLLQAETEARTGLTYLLTTNEDGSPHAVTVTARWEIGRLSAQVGARSERNIDKQPRVSFAWPPESPGGHTLFVDADAVLLTDGSISARPIRGVLHRPGSVAGRQAACASDCLQIFPA